MNPPAAPASTPDMLALALQYAAQGIPVFPCRSSEDDTGQAKSPYTHNGLKAATVNERIIARWWTDHPTAAVGIPTGPRSGFFVVDLDKKQDADGEVELARLEAANEPLPATRVVETPSGGKHLLFKHVDGIGNRGRFAAACDIRGDGGYVLAAGSVMGDGTFYDAVNPEQPIAEAPEWLVKLITRPQYTTPTQTAGEPSTAYVGAAVSSELSRLVSTRANRNNALNDASFNLGQFVGAGALGRHEAESRLYAAAVANGYVDKDGERSARQTIKSGLDRGAESPRQIPERTDTGMASEGARLASKIIHNALHGRTGRIETAEEVAANEAENGQVVEVDNTIRATPFEWKDPSTLPRREFVYGTSLVRKYVSVTVAPGGIGKSSLSVVETLAMVTGRPLLGTRPTGKLRVWLVNLEDDRDELERRVMAACIHYKIAPGDIEGLFLDSGRERGIVIARDDKRGIVIAKPIVEQIIETIRQNKIDVLIIDPFVSSHNVSENDNGAIDLVTKLWSQIAGDTNSAIEIIHHVRKVEGREITVDDARGAGSLISAARSARVLNRMTEDQAAKAGVSADDRLTIFSVQRGKSNLARMSAHDEWRRLESVGLGNGTGPARPQDHAPVVVEWKWPSKDEVASSISAEQMEMVRVKVANTTCRASDQSDEWVGYVVADAIGEPLEISRKKSPLKTKVANLVQTWLKDGVLELHDEPDPRHPMRTLKCVRVGRQEG